MEKWLKWLEITKHTSIHFSHWMYGVPGSNVQHLARHSGQQTPKGQSFTTSRNQPGYVVKELLAEHQILWKVAVKNGRHTLGQNLFETIPWEDPSKFDRWTTKQPKRLNPNRTDQIYVVNKDSHVGASEWKKCFKRGTLEISPCLWCQDW